MVVLFYHFTRGYDSFFSHHDWVLYPAWGEYGVHLFFMISGFVMLMMVERCKRPSDFIVARFSRLYPAYVVCLFISFFVVRAAGLPGREVTGTQAVLNLLMIHQFFKIPPVDGAYWSLQVQFFFSGLLLVLFVSRRQRQVVRVVTVLVLLHLLDHAVAPADRFQSGSAARIAILAVKQVLVLDYIPLFGCGMVVYRIRESGWRWRYLPLLALFLAAAVVGQPALGAIVIPVSLGLLWVATSRRGVRLIPSQLLFLGTIAYPLYLLHQNIGYAIIRHNYLTGGHAWGGILTAFCIVLGLATLISFTVEWPTMRWIREAYRARRRRAAAAPSRTLAVESMLPPVPLLSPEARELGYRVPAFVRAFLSGIHLRGSY